MFDKIVQEMLTKIMFEEKAEKWVKDNLHSTEEDYIKAFVDGAEYGYNEKYSEFEKELKWERDTKSELADYLGKANDRVADLEAQIEKMKKYIKTCWVEENLNDYSSYMTNTSDEFRDLVKEIRNGR